MMTTPERLRRRQRLESLFIGILALALAASQFWDDYQEEQASKETQVQTCENGNEAREGHLLLWNFVIDLSASSTDPDEEPPTAAERAALEQIRDWLEELFAPRDCSDLTKEYELPPPPPLIENGSG